MKMLIELFMVKTRRSALLSQGFDPPRSETSRSEASVECFSQQGLYRFLWVHALLENDAGRRAARILRSSETCYHASDGKPRSRPTDAEG
jgi:hypothetical protein